MDLVKMLESFNKAYTKNLNSKTNVKGTGNNALKYLSWSEAWAEFVKIYPNATYEIKKNDIGLPVFSDESGAMVYTTITANGLTHEMWLPIMDGANRAMKSKPYIYQVKEYAYNEATRRKEATGNIIDKNVEPYTMFDINKTLMRCLTKNMAMFGLGLYIYNNEDMPEVEEEQIKYITKEQLEQLEELIKKIKKDGIREKFCIAFEIKDLKDMPMIKFASAIKRLNLTIEEEKKENGN